MVSVGGVANSVKELQEKLQLQELISNTSAILINLPAHQIDSQIDQGLKRIVEFLGIDRSSFGEFSAETGDIFVTHSYAAPDIEPYPKVLLASLLPWYANRLHSGEVFFIENPADLPETAIHERAYCAQSGLKSQLTIPFSVGGNMLCAIGFGSFHIHRAWPPSLIEQLKRVGEIFAQAVYRMRAEERINDQLARLESQFEFEKLISNLSARFVNLPVEQVDEEIEKGLQQLWKFLQIDRCRLLKISGDKKKATVIHAHSAEGSSGLSDVSYSDDFPWHSERLLSGETICINIKDLPPEADFDKRSAERIGIRSHMLIPLKVDESVTYVLTASTNKNEKIWPEDVVSRVRLVGEIFANALIRKNAQDEITKSYRQIKELKDRLEAEAAYLRSEIKVIHRYDDIVGESKAILDVLHRVEQVANTDSAVLILGETGTGKELIARAIHNQSSRKSRAMVKVNCSALPSTLVESELFGREKGAYTGALTKQAGRFEIADGSTIFLDEISEMSPELQAKLLRVLQEGEFERLGNPRTIKVDVRIIAATNRDLAASVRNGTFREDLYYRLNVFPIRIPALRERLKDIPLLTMSFLKEFTFRMGKIIRRIPASTMETLMQYSWPGNVRELRNVIEHAVIICDGDELHIPLPDHSSTKLEAATLFEAESKHILDVLESTAWRIKGENGAARILGLKPSTLYNKMKRLGIEPSGRKDRIRT